MPERKGLLDVLISLTLSSFRVVSVKMDNERGALRRMEIRGLRDASTG